MTRALSNDEKVHIIAYNKGEVEYIETLLSDENVSLENVSYHIHETDDVWARDNGPIFLYDSENDYIYLTGSSMVGVEKFPTRMILN